MKKKNVIKLFTAIVIACAIVISLPVFSQESTKLTDPEIASVAVTANQIDIDYANIAKKKSTNADILKFAETMAADHKAVIDQAVALVTKLNVTPKNNAVTEKYLADASKTKKALNSKSGNAFNKAYIDNEVAYHKAVINAVENVLIPDSQNAELKSLLQNVLPVLKTHLEHAIMVQKTISK
ncbi:MAG: DUF4142 domain-containing protein [Parafilimonas sp.]